MADALWRRLTEAGEAAKGTRVLSLFERDPDRFDGFSVQLGDTLLDFSKTAIDARALALDENNAETLSNLSFILHSIERFAESEEYARRAVEISPKHAQACNNLAVALAGNESGSAVRIHDHRACF